MGENDTKFGPGMEGEGSKSADKRYREAASAFARKTDEVKAGAKEAERGLESNRDDLEDAVEAGKKPSAGDLEGDLQHPRHDADLEPDA